MSLPRVQMTRTIKVNAEVLTEVQLLSEEQGTKSTLCKKEIEQLSNEKNFRGCHLKKLFEEHTELTKIIEILNKKNQEIRLKFDKISQEKAQDTAKLKEWCIAVANKNLGIQSIAMRNVQNILSIINDKIENLQEN